MLIIFPLSEMLDLYVENFTLWKNDDQCDDINNNNDTNSFDGGDCCYEDAIKQYCFDCSCKSKLIQISMQHKIFI